MDDELEIVFDILKEKEKTYKITADGWRAIKHGDIADVWYWRRRVIARMLEVFEEEMRAERDFYERHFSNEIKK